MASGTKPPPKGKGHGFPLFATKAVIKQVQGISLIDKILITIAGLQEAVSNAEKIDARLMQVYTWAGAQVGHMKHLLGPEDMWPDDVEDYLKDIEKQVDDIHMLITGRSNSRVRNTVTSEPPDVDSLESELTKLFNSIMYLCAMDTRTALPRIEQTLSESAMHTVLSHADTGWHTNAGCAPRTRRVILNAIMKWCESAEMDPNPCWLLGPAGYGKTAIAHEVARLLHNSQNLPSCFFFKRGISTLKRAFSTLAYDLFSRFTELREGALGALENDHRLGNLAPEIQFQEFILKPVKELRVSGKLLSSPPRIVIWDGLDECRSTAPHEWKTLLEIIRTQLRDLSPIVKFFITCRPLRDIHELLPVSRYAPSTVASTSGPFSGCIMLRRQDNLIDIPLYLEHELGDKDADSTNKWPKPVQVAQLTKRADGLFLWAAVAVRYIKTALDPQTFLEELLNDSTPDPLIDANRDFDTLYASVLRDIDARDSSNPFKSIIGMLLDINDNPRMTIAGLEGLTGYRRTKFVLDDLGSILTQKDEESLYPLHQSFTTYITNKNRCTLSRYRIVQRNRHSMLILRCLDILVHPNSELRRNIYELEAPSLLNDNTESAKVATRILNSVPSELAYACACLGYHMKEAKTIPDILTPLHTFLTEQLLDWLVLLSLLGKVDCAFSTLYQIQKHVKDHEDGASLVQLASESLKFFETFENLLTVHAGHTRMSGLLFMPRESELWRHYKDSARSDMVVRRWVPPGAKHQKRATSPDLRLKFSGVGDEVWIQMNRHQRPMMRSTSERPGLDPTGIAPFEQSSVGPYELDKSGKSGAWLMTKGPRPKRVFWVPEDYKDCFACKEDGACVAFGRMSPDFVPDVTTISIPKLANW